MPDKSIYDFLDSVESGPGPTLTGPDLNEGAARRSFGVPPAPNRPFEADFISRNQRDIPIDLDIEAPTGLKTKLLMRKRPEDMVSYLEEMVGKGNVRLADDGTPLITIENPNKKGQPVEFSPFGRGGNVVAHVQSQLPEAALSLGAMAAVKGAAPLVRRAAGAIGPRAAAFAAGRTGGAYKTLAELVAAGVGEEAGGTLKDLAFSEQPTGEILAEHAGELPGTAARNVLLGTAATGAAKLGGRMLSPFGGPMQEMERGLTEAVSYMKDKFGVDYPLTHGERISSPLFKRVEATMSRNPGSSSQFDKVQRGKVEAFRQIYEKMLSSKIDPADIGALKALEEDVGQEAINAIRQSIHPLQKAEEMARSVTAQRANDALLGELEQAAGPARQLAPNVVGSKLRAGAFSKRAAFETESDRLYSDLYALPGGTDKALVPPNLAADARRLLAEQPSVEKTVNVPTQIVGPNGRPLISAETQTEVLNPFVPEGIRPMLEKLSSTDGGRFSLRDLVKMRTEVRNGIKQGQAVPGVDTHYLGEIEDSLTRSIEQSTAALPTQDLRQAWERANNYYRDNVGQFKDKNVAKLFRDNQTGSFIQDEDLVRNIGPSEYQTYKQFFGPNSEEFGALKRNLVDALIPHGGAGDLIDPKEFLSRLYAFTDPRKNKVIADDILGPQMTRRLERISGLLKNIQEGDVVDRDGIINLLMEGRHNKLAGSLDEMINAQRKLTTAYKSEIVRDIADGKLGQNFDSTKFVDRLWDTSSVAEVKAIKAQLADYPQVRENLERKIAERIFERSQRTASGNEPVNLATGAPLRRSSANALEDVFGNAQNKAKLAEIIGPEKMKDFEQLAKMMASGGSGESAFAAASGLAQANQIQKMLRADVLSYAPHWALQKLVAAIYFIPAVGKAFTNQLGRSPEAQANAVKAAILSGAFSDAMAEDYGDKSGTFINQLLDAVDLFKEQGPAGAKAVSNQGWARKFLEEADRTNPNRPRVTPIP